MNKAFKVLGVFIGGLATVAAIVFGVLFYPAFPLLAIALAGVGVAVITQLLMRIMQSKAKGKLNNSVKIVAGFLLVALSITIVVLAFYSILPISLPIAVALTAVTLLLPLLMRGIEKALAGKVINNQKRGVIALLGASLVLLALAASFLITLQFGLGGIPLKIFSELAIVLAASIFVATVAKIGEVGLGGKEKIEPELTLTPELNTTESTLLDIRGYDDLLNQGKLDDLKERKKIVESGNIGDSLSVDIDNRLATYLASQGERYEPHRNEGESRGEAMEREIRALLATKTDISDDVKRQNCVLALFQQNTPGSFYAATISDHLSTFIESNDGTSTSLDNHNSSYILSEDSTKNVTLKLSVPVQVRDGRTGTSTQIAKIAIIQTIDFSDPNDPKYKLVSLDIKPIEEGLSKVNNTRLQEEINTLSQIFKALQPPVEHAPRSQREEGPTPVSSRRVSTNSTGSIISSTASFSLPETLSGSSPVSSQANSRRSSISDDSLVMAAPLTLPPQTAKRAEEPEIVPGSSKSVVTLGFISSDPRLPLVTPRMIAPARDG